VPPLAEQHRIVAKVDELMALCDRLGAQQADAASAHATLVKTLLDTLTQSQSAADFAANWQRIAQHFDTLFTTESSLSALKQTVLQLAVMGKLVPQDPNDKPASGLLKRIQAAKARLVAEGKIRKDEPLPVIGEDEKPFELPEGWEWRRFDELLQITGGVTLGRKLHGRNLVSLPYLRVANVQRGYLVLDVIKNVEVPIDEIGKYQLQQDDLLITEGGDWDKVGRTAIWNSEITQCLHQNHVFRARKVVADWNSRWAEMYLNSFSAREYFAGSSKQTTNLASINMTQLRGCVFPVPPLAEQRRIVAKVDELLVLCGQLAARLKAARELAAKYSTAVTEAALEAA
jgi:type I restriction enzyme S subunit